MKRTLLLIAGMLYLITTSTMIAQNYILQSPDKKIKSEITIGENVYYAIKYEEKFVLMPSPIIMVVNDGQKLGKEAKVINSRNKQVDANIKTVWGIQNNIPEQYNELVIDFVGNYSIHFRAYNDGVAYRFETRMKGKIKIINEESEFRLDGWPEGWFSESHGSYETQYNLKKVWDLSKTEHYFLPCVINTTAGVKMAIVESDLIDYPCMHLLKNTGFNNDLILDFDKYPLKTIKGGFDNYTPQVVERADYIAYTEGTRMFPWRACIVASSDAQLADNNMVYKLAKPLEIANPEWIKPGQVMWDWWADYVIDGVDFETGVNTKTYLYHADFAAKWKIPYMIVDWHWSDGQDLLNTNPEVDIQKIISYANSKGVKVILWCPAFTIDRQLDKALNAMSSWGAAGIKVDFFDRWDQLANQMYERIAKGCAKRNMLVDFHGSYLPTGLHRAYPNIINYEAVLGNEMNKFGNNVTPEHKATIPFIRMLAGPMDFTPGGMRNAVGNNFVKRSSLPFTQGTRCNEMALFVVYFEALKMLSDAASEYAKEPEVFSFLTQIPTVWDESKVLEAKLSDHVIVARRKDKIWYVGGINDESGKKEFDLTFSFLEKGKTYQAKIYTDGMNTDKNGCEYKYTEQQINAETVLKVKMNKAGGFVMKIEF